MLQYGVLSVKLYEQQYRGVLNKIFCGLCKNRCMKSARRYSIIKEVEAIEKNESSKAEESIVKIGSEAASRVSALFSLLGNLTLLYDTYYIALDNVDNNLYKYVVLLYAIFLSSVYLISYSTYTYTIYFKGGKGASLNFDKKECF